MKSCRLHVVVTHGAQPLVQRCPDVVPQSARIWPENVAALHASLSFIRSQAMRIFCDLNRRCFRQIRAGDDVEVPLREVCGARRDSSLRRMTKVESSGLLRTARSPDGGHRGYHLCDKREEGFCCPFVFGALRRRQHRKTCSGYSHSTKSMVAEMLQFHSKKGLQFEQNFHSYIVLKGPIRALAKKYQNNLFFGNGYPVVMMPVIFCRVPASAQQRRASCSTDAAWRQRPGDGSPAFNSS
jgi:hypothetical protein